MAELNRPGWIRILFTTLRPSQLSLLFGPLLTALVFFKDYFDLSLAFSLGLSLGFFYWASLLIDDYWGHMSGVDRLHQLSGSRVIQRGWMKAREVKILAIVFYLLAAVVSAPILVQISHPLWILLLLSFSVTLYFLVPKRVRYLGLGDFLTFVLFGPGLTMGVELLLKGTLGPEGLTLGFLFGYMATLTRQSRQLERLLVDRERREASFIGFLGYDRARIFLMTELGVMAGLAPLLIYFLKGAGPQLVLFFVLHLLALKGPFCAARRLGGPLSSERQVLRRQMDKAHLLFSALVLWCLLSSGPIFG